MLFQEDIYMYANIKGSMVPQPLLDMPLDLHIAENIKTDISVNGVVYYTEYQTIRSKGKVILNIGKSVTISIMEEKHHLTIKFSPTSILKFAKTDLEFILALQKYNQFEMSGHILPLDSTKMFSEDKVEKLQKNLKYCRDLIAVLNIFNLDTEIDMSSFSNEDCRHSNMFIKGLVDNEVITGLKDNLPFVMKLNYLGAKVVIGFERDDKQDAYRIYDYFSKPISLYYEDDTGRYETSKYDILDVDDFLAIRNIDYNNLLKSYQEIPEGKIYERANWVLLKLLLAYDKSEDKRKDILDTAYNIAEWLYKIHVEEELLEFNIRRLNFYQVLKRRRNLTKECKKELFCMADNLQEQRTIRIGAYLLLDNQIAAETLFDELNEDMKNEFSTYPIFRFWNDSVE